MGNNRIEDEIAKTANVAEYLLDRGRGYLKFGMFLFKWIFPIGIVLGVLAYVIFATSGDDYMELFWSLTTESAITNLLLLISYICTASGLLLGFYCLKLGYHCIGLGQIAKNTENNADISDELPEL